jgi:hypothetical protein
MQRLGRSTTKEKHVGSFIKQAAEGMLAAVIAALGSLATVRILPGNGEFVEHPPSRVAPETWLVYVNGTVCSLSRQHE